MYSLLDVADALAYRVSELPDEDSERAADLHRALQQADKQTSEVLTMWAEGYTLREISDQLWQVNSPNRVSKVLREGLRQTRSRMNGAQPQEQTSKCA